MNYLTSAFVVLIASCYVSAQYCGDDCPRTQNETVCAFNEKSVQYKLFRSECALRGHMECTKEAYNITPIKFCMKSLRRMDGESCPMFCAHYYRPVCGAPKARAYGYRSFNNRCYLDMINCHSDDDFDGYTEVPLSYCSRHAMKNIFSERIMIGK